MLGCDELFEEELRIDVGDDPRRMNGFAACENHAARAPAIDEHRTDGSIGAKGHAARGALPRHRKRNRAHASARMPPLTSVAVYFAEHVVQENVSGTWRVRAREVADD